MKTAFYRRAQLGATVLLLALGQPPAARAYPHPSAPFTAADLSTLKANLNAEPWKSGYTRLTTDSNGLLTYTMQGPFAEVGRTPNVNLSQYASDMEAVYKLAFIGYFTGNTAYSSKARSILLAWAGTHTVCSGAEMYLGVSDNVMHIVTGADILRGTYAGWSAADTTTVKNYFSNVLWPLTGIPGPLRSSNQGGSQIKIGMALAAFLDDPAKVSQCIAAFRTDACSALMTTQSNGQVGDTGRDQGHAAGELGNLMITAEIAWKTAGVDLYGLLNNRLLTCAEYFSKYNTGGATPWIKAGTCYGLYTAIGGTPDLRPSPAMLNIVEGAYGIRKGLGTPSTLQLRNLCAEDSESWLHRKSADASTAAALVDIPAVGPAAVTTGLTRTDIGGATPAGTASYGNGTWTVTGGGADIWGGVASDSFTFLQRQVTGDATIIARVTSLGNTNANAKAGLCLRESLAGNAKMAMIAEFPAKGLSTSGRGADQYSHDVFYQDHPAGLLPYWVKLERIGDRVSAYDSADGVNWTPVKSYEFTMSGTYYLGLFVESHVNGTATTATFTNVSLSAGIPNGTYRIRNRANGQYLDNLGNFADGDPVSQWASSASNNQKWTVTTGDYSKLACVTGGKYLDSVNRTGNNTPVGQWTGGGSPNQQWTIVNLGTGYYKIVNRANGYCLDTGGSATPTPMEFWASGTSFNQQWEFVP